MAELTVLSDAQVLMPNQSHQNFTQTEEIIPAGTKVKGSEKIIKGKRRGEPFEYKLFFTDTNKIIYLNKVKPMENKVTEVKLGADATVVKIPTANHFSKNTLISVAVVGGGAFAFCKHKKYEMKKTAIITISAIIAGYFLGQYIDKKGITIKKTK